MRKIGIDCTFAKDGKVRVRRVQVNEQWQVVEQGRQWLDENGRHVLIMLPHGQVREILLSSRSLTWEMRTDDQLPSIV